MTLEPNFHIHICITDSQQQQHHHHLHIINVIVIVFLNVDSIGLFIKQTKQSKTKYPSERGRERESEREMCCACKPIQLNSLSANVFSRVRARQNIARYARQPMTQQTIQFHFGHTHAHERKSPYVFQYVCMHVSILVTPTPNVWYTRVRTLSRHWIVYNYNLVVDNTICICTSYNGITKRRERNEVERKTSENDFEKYQ